MNAYFALHHSCNKHFDLIGQKEMSISHKISKWRSQRGGGFGGWSPPLSTTIYNIIKTCLLEFDC